MTTLGPINTLSPKIAKPRFRNISQLVLSIPLFPVGLFVDCFIEEHA